MAKRPTPTVDPPPRPPVMLPKVPQGMRAINLALNESAYGASPKALEAAERRLRAAHLYPDPSSSALRAALARVHGLDAARIVCGNGSEELLDVIARLFVRPGDAILMSQNGFFQFALAAGRLNASLIRAPERDLVADADALLAAVTPAVKLVFLAVPNNPTGTVMPTAEIVRLHAGLPSDVALVLDCAYGEFLDDAELAGLMALAEQAENVIVTRTFSKAFGLAALRIGWCHAPAWMVPGLSMLRGIGSVNAVAQAAAEAALDDLDFMRRAVDEALEERAFVAAGLNALGLETVAGRANFVLTRFSDRPGKDAASILPQLLAEAGIILRAVAEPGFANWVRVGLGRRADNELFLATLGELLGREAQVAATGR